MRRALIPALVFLVSATAHATAEREYEEGEYGRGARATAPAELVPFVTHADEAYELAARAAYKLDASDHYAVGPLAKTK